MTQMNKEREWYADLFTEFERGLNGQSKSAMHDIRKKAIRWFSENGFPTVRQEEWRFTNVSPISAIAFNSSETKIDGVTLENIRPYLIDENLIRLVFVNGNFSRELSQTDGLPEGVLVQSLNETLKIQQNLIENNLARYAKIEENGFVALNTAFMKDGAFIHVAKNVVYEKPIHLIFMTTEKAKECVVHPRNLIKVENNAQMSFIESYVSLAETTSFTNPVTEVMAGENAVIQHYKIQQESIKVFHTALLQIYQRDNTNYTSFNFVFGGSIVRNDLNVVLDGKGSECTLNGLYLARNQQLIDNHSVIDHVRPHCFSRELYKGILDDQARAVFSGKIHVHPDAQKTDAIQSNQNLLLSEEATVDTKPQLEIYADDVRCTHGGTVGQINEDGVFYLRTRGISEATAKNLMIQAFAGDVTERIKEDKIREYVEGFVQKHLAHGHLKD